MYDYSAWYMEPVIGRFTSVDPHAENYFSWSPYVYVGNNPILNVDPSGEDYWSTNDPELIKQFLSALKGSSSNIVETFNYENWDHMEDKDFLEAVGAHLYQGLTYNDKTGILYSSEADYINGEAIVTGKSKRVSSYLDEMKVEFITSPKANGRIDIMGGSDPIFLALLGGTSTGIRFINTISNSLTAPTPLTITLPHVASLCVILEEENKDREMQIYLDTLRIFEDGFTDIIKEKKEETIMKVLRIYIKNGLIWAHQKLNKK